MCIGDEHMEDNLCIGIDPGKKGALSLLRGNAIEIYPFDPHEYISVLRASLSCEGVKCCIEDVHALRGNGITSSFVFGKNYGWILGALDSIGIPYQAVSVQKWKKEFGLTSDKAKSIEVCHRLFPNVNLKRTERCKKDDDGYAESLLLAEYARRHM